MTKPPEQTDEFSIRLKQCERIIFHYIWLKVRDIHETEEIFQETVLLCWKKRDQLRDEDRFTAWSIKLARTAVSRYLRSRKSRDASESGYAVRWAVPETELTALPEKQAVEDEEMRAALDALFALPERCRMVFYLHTCEGLSLSKIGELLGIHEATAAKRLKKAKELLERRVRPISSYPTAELFSAISISELSRKTLQMIEESQLHDSAVEGAVSISVGAVFLSLISKTKYLIALCSFLLWQTTWFLFLFLSGTLWCRTIVANEPSLPARRWIVRRMSLAFFVFFHAPLVMFLVLIYVLEHRMVGINNSLFFAGIFLSAILYVVESRYRYKYYCRNREAWPEIEYGTLATRINVGLAFSFVFFILFTVFLHVQIFRPLFAYLAESGKSELLPLQYCNAMCLYVFFLSIPVIASFLFRNLLALCHHESAALTPGGMKPYKAVRDELIYMLPFIMFIGTPHIGHFLFNRSDIPGVALRLAVFVILWYLVLYRNVRQSGRWRWRRIAGMSAVQILAVFIHNYCAPH